VEVDGGLEVLAVAEPAGGGPDRLDACVQPFRGGVGDPVGEVGEQAGSPARWRLSVRAASEWRSGCRRFGTEREPQDIQDPVGRHVTIGAVRRVCEQDGRTANLSPLAGQPCRRDARKSAGDRRSRAECCPRHVPEAVDNRCDPVHVEQQYRRLLVMAPPRLQGMLGPAVEQRATRSTRRAAAPGSIQPDRLAPVQPLHPTDGRGCRSRGD
jgi:hypothetical protein